MGLINIVNMVIGKEPKYKLAEALKKIEANSKWIEGYTLVPVDPKDPYTEFKKIKKELAKKEIGIIKKENSKRSEQEKYRNILSNNGEYLNIGKNVIANFNNVSKKRQVSMEK